MNIQDLPPESLKAFASILQQAATITTNHQRASNALAHFELELANPERGLIINPKNEEKTRKALASSVKIAADNSKLIEGLGVVS